LGRGYDFVVVGSGPNGLVAGITLAEAGAAVLLIEAAEVAGGGCRSAPLTLPGFTHDICSAVHPTGALSPAFRQIGLEQLGVQFVWSEIPLAHPLPDGDAAVLDRSLPATAARLGRDGQAWERLMAPFASQSFLQAILKPLWFGLESPVLKARFGLKAVRSCDRLGRSCFRESRARALFGGCAAHSTLALDRAGTASFGVVLAVAGHVIGWPLVRGGSQQIVAGLLRRFSELGGQVELGKRITAWDQLPSCRAVLFDLNPHQIAGICARVLPPGYLKRLSRFRRGPGVFKVDWALSGPIPWLNSQCARAATVHVGGPYEEVFQAEAEVGSGIAPAKPFVLLVQASQFDPSRSPAGQHVGWAYCHVPNGCREDMTERIERQIDRFAPGFRDLILARHTISPMQVESHNPSMMGGDISGGANDLMQFLFRPMLRWNPYATPNPHVYICSSSTPPGGGVHGMCGRLAAQAALKRSRIWP